MSVAGIRRWQIVQTKSLADLIPTIAGRRRHDPSRPPLPPLRKPRKPWKPAVPLVGTPRERALALIANIESQLAEMDINDNRRPYTQRRLAKARARLAALPVA